MRRQKIPPRVLRKYHLSNLLTVIFGDKLILSLVFLYCVFVLFYHIFVKANPCLHGFQVYGSKTSIQLILKYAKDCLECGWNNDVPFHVLYANLQFIASGYAHQLLYVLVDIQHDLVLPQGLCEDSDGMDLVHSHNDIQNLEKLCIGSLNTSDERRELLIISDLHLNLCFVKLSMWIHLLMQVKWGSIVPHFPFLHV